jgi:hypothetical protein
MHRYATAVSSACSIRCNSCPANTTIINPYSMHCAYLPLMLYSAARCFSLHCLPYAFAWSPTHCSTPMQHFTHAVPAPCCAALHCNTLHCTALHHLLLAGACQCTNRKSQMSRAGGASMGHSLGASQPGTTTQSAPRCGSSST